MGRPSPELRSRSTFDRSPVRESRTPGSVGEVPVLGTSTRPTTVDCDVTERPVMAIPMSVLPEIGGSLGRPDLAPDCDHTRDLRSTPGGQSRSPTCRHGPGAGDLAALPARGHTLA